MPSTTLMLLLVVPFFGVILVFMLLTLVVGQMGRNAAKRVPAVRPAPSLSPKTHGEVMQLIGQGKQIQAVKVVREETGLGLKEAKDLVDALRAGRPAPQAPSLSPRVYAEVVEFLERDEQIQAVKVVREETGLGLKEAKQLVDAVRDGRLEPPATAPGRLLSERVRAFLDAGDRPSAVALVQAETGMGAEEAGRFVDALA